MILDIIFGSLAGLSLVLLLWQWVAALRFPLHKRMTDGSFAPEVTLLKPLKGCDEHTEACLRSWFTQKYAGRVQIIFGVAKADDPVCAIVEKLMREFSGCDARLMVCENLTGANAKVSKLARMEAEAKHELVVVSDADVWVPEDFLANVVGPLKDCDFETGNRRAVGPLTPSLLASQARHELVAPQETFASRTVVPLGGERATDGRITGDVGLVNCFYRLGNLETMAMQWEAVAINADFWSQVLQSKSLKPLDFALGAVMVTRRKNLAEIGGFKALENCLADDYQLGHRIAKQGHRIELSPVVVECRSAPMGWGEVWRHQLRWARTIRVCQPAPYFFSILSNVTLWAVLWALFGRSEAAWHSETHFNSGGGGGSFHSSVHGAIVYALVIVVIRILVAGQLQKRLQKSWNTGTHFWLVPVKDLLQAAIWLGAFAGSGVEWRGQKFRVKRDGTLEKI